MIVHLHKNKVIIFYDVHAFRYNSNMWIFKHSALKKEKLCIFHWNLSFYCHFHCYSKVVLYFIFIKANTCNNLAKLWLLTVKWKEKSLLCSLLRRDLSLWRTWLCIFEFAVINNSNDSGFSTFLSTCWLVISDPQEPDPELLLKND